MKIQPNLSDDHWEQALAAWRRWERIHDVGGVWFDADAVPALQELLTDLVRTAKTGRDLFLCLCACLGTDQAIEIAEEALYDRQVLDKDRD